MRTSYAYIRIILEAKRLEAERRLREGDQFFRPLDFVLDFVASTGLLLVVELLMFAVPYWVGGGVALLWGAVMVTPAEAVLIGFLTIAAAVIAVEIALIIWLAGGWLVRVWKRGRS